MNARQSVLLSALGAVLLASLAMPEPVSAQRTAVRVVRRPVVVRAYYGPAFYDPWFYGYRYPWYPGFYGYQRGYYDLSGSLRLQVSPRETEVFIDGYYAGTVDDFDGVFQRLHVEPGEHELELFLPGYRSVRQRIYLQPGRTTRIRLDMQELGPGDPAPVRPAAAAGAVRRAPQDRDVIRRRDPRDRRDDPDADGGARDADTSYGRISLRVQPADATVLIDGERWEGPAPDERLIVELAPGRHVIEIEKDGYRRYTTELDVRRGDTTSLNVSLTRQ